MCVPQWLLQLADLSFSPGSRSISSANEVCAINKWWEVHAPEWCVRRGWNHAWRRGGIRSISSSCHFLQPVWGQQKQGVILQEPLIFSHLRTPEASCPFLMERASDFAAEPLCIYSGSTAGLGPRGLLHLWMCRVELWLESWQSWAMFRREPRAAGEQESAAVGHRGLMAFLTFTGPAASHSTEIHVSCLLLSRISGLKFPTIVNFYSLHDYVHLNEG